MSSFNCNKYINIQPNKRNNNLINHKKKQSLINILIRTTYRPEYFEKCINSIYKQKYNNFKIICCYDDERCLDYLKKYKSKIEYFFIEIESNASHKYNDYCNHLMDMVKNGWIMFLDDDDILASNKSLAIINNYLNNENNILFWKVKIGKRIIIPENINKIKKGKISGIGFCFHSKFKNLSKWKPIRCSDFHFINLLLKTKKNFNKIKLPIVLTKVNHELLGNQGMQNPYDFKDFVNNKNIKQIYFSKSLLHLKDKMKEQFNLDEYTNENDSALFFGVYDNNDFIKINNHKCKKFVMFEETDIKNYKLVKAVNFLTLSKSMKDYLRNEKIFSRLINLDVNI
jgi:hypothetical protein